ncbi:hypothetical protein BJ684DRAFT_21354 [Piptocephalis cylindrospora]|uniref:Uncharacterized protein n=1 Tax=Piptocephalis cylindrospora TaxID=1907219 RepID=A0A4P9Y2P0_9FUNG|nr:hypothetical protein BJ684DRAFT_21354 [Piptocephalis cylindrospora]|eukprot:RKP12080.1 hypothetical protein BJ684DRAFT_21354 [Piptocephalis cylindrospora]
MLPHIPHLIILLTLGLVCASGSSSSDPLVLTSSNDTSSSSDPSPLTSSNNTSSSSDPLSLVSSNDASSWTEVRADAPIVISNATLAIISPGLSSDERAQRTIRQGARLAAILSTIRDKDSEYCERRAFAYECPKAPYRIYAHSDVVLQAEELFKANRWFHGVAQCTRQGDVSIARFNSFRHTTTVICLPSPEEDAIV